MRVCTLLRFVALAALANSGCPSPGTPPPPPPPSPETTLTTSPPNAEDAALADATLDAADSLETIAEGDATVADGTKAASFDSSVDPWDAGPKATSVALALKKPASACGIVFTLTVESHKQYADPKEGSVGIWEMTLSKGGQIIAHEQTAKSLYLEGTAFGCLFVVEGDHGTERVTAVPGAPKPLTEDEALELAKTEAKKRGLPSGGGSSYDDEDGVLDVQLSGVGGKSGGRTRLRVGLYTKRILSIEVEPPTATATTTTTTTTGGGNFSPSPKPMPNPPPMYSDPCKSDADCVATSWAGCCDCCGTDMPYAISKSHHAKDLSSCGAVDCAPCNEVKCPPSPKSSLKVMPKAVCTKSRCALQ